MIEFITNLVQNELQHVIMNSLFFLLFLYILAFFINIFKSIYIKSDINEAIKIGKIILEEAKQKLNVKINSNSQVYIPTIQTYTLEQMTDPNYFLDMINGMRNGANQNIPTLEYLSSKYNTFHSMTQKYINLTIKIATEARWEESYLDTDNRLTIEAKLTYVNQSIPLLDYIKKEYGLVWVLKSTMLFPSFILGCIGIPVNCFSKLVSLSSGILILYGVFEKFVLPILKSKGLL